MEQAKYLVRPNDFNIFEIDPVNECYKPYAKVDKFIDHRPNAYSHFTYENLTENYGFFPITKDLIPHYEAKCSDYYKFLGWQHRNDGHGGGKGGTREEYDEYLESVKRFNEKYPNWKEERDERNKKIAKNE